MVKHQVSGRSSDRLKFIYRIIATGIRQVPVGKTAVAGYKMLHDTMIHSTPSTSQV